MATFNSDTRGGIDDRVRITFGRVVTHVAESYTVRHSFLTQPSTWSIRLGSERAIREMLAAVQPNTEYTLSVGDVLQQTGRVEDIDDTTDANGGGSITISGRDALAPVIDGYIETDQSFTDASYADLVKSALNQIFGDDYTLRYTNQDNRSIQVGGTIIQSDLPIDPVGDPTNAAKDRPMQAKAGQRWFEFLKEQLDRAGMFLWAAADGTFVLSAPSTAQKPIVRIVHGRAAATNESNATMGRRSNKTSRRYSKYLIYGRGGGGQDGRQKTTGVHEDAEMVGYGINRPLVVRDHKSRTNQHAETIARRKFAEHRRAGWSLVYTFPGHTAPRLDQRDRVVWAIDTMVEVDDRARGIADVFWVESVEFSRAPHTTTTVTLMRPEDLVFGGENE